MHALLAEMSTSELGRQLGQAGLRETAGGQNSAGQSKPNLGRTDSGALEFTPTAASASSTTAEAITAFGRREGERHHRSHIPTCDASGGPHTGSESLAMIEL